jgi:hypothetical protein
VLSCPSILLKNGGGSDVSRFRDDGFDPVLFIVVVVVPGGGG